jgi:hypothetical protein
MSMLGSLRPDISVAIALRQTAHKRRLFDGLSLSIMRTPNLSDGEEAVCRLEIFIGMY